MSVEISPQELGFHRPFTVEVSEVLKIKNPNSSPVAFKVKTTAPKQYCVRPNSGRVEPGKEVEVQVILQAMKQEPAPDAKCRDKFLVQSVAISGDKEFSNLAAIWDGIDKSQVQEKKIRVAFLAPTNSSATASAEHLSTPSKPTLGSDHEATPDAAPPAYSSPSESSAPKSPPRAAVQQRDEQPSSGMGSVVAQKISEAGADLKDRLAQAEQQIPQLQNDQGGLRQRKPAEEKAPSAPASQIAQQARQGTEGVPVKITAILCLVSFLLAYLFF